MRCKPFLGARVGLAERGTGLAELLADVLAVVPFQDPLDRLKTTSFSAFRFSAGVTGKISSPDVVENPDSRPGRALARRGPERGGGETQDASQGLDGVEPRARLATRLDRR